MARIKISALQVSDIIADTAYESKSKTRGRVESIELCTTAPGNLHVHIQNHSTTWCVHRDYEVIRLGTSRPERRSDSVPVASTGPRKPVPGPRGGFSALAALCFDGAPSVGAARQRV